ncbi:putative protein kinase, partial [Reticulomyxa filosa]
MTSKKEASERKVIDGVVLESGKEDIQPYERSSCKRGEGIARRLEGDRSGKKKGKEEEESVRKKKMKKEREEWEKYVEGKGEEDLKEKNNEEKEIELERWIKYMNWIKVNYPTMDNAESKLNQVLERCCKKYQEKEKYRNNKKYIKIWLEYINTCQDKLEIFNWLRQMKIGERLPLFWRAWATVAEKEMKFTLSEQILREAMKQHFLKQDQDLQDIQKAYQQFCIR